MTVLLRLIIRAALLPGRLIFSAFDFARKIVVYLCLVLVLAASALADRLDQPDKT